MDLLTHAITVPQPLAWAIASGHCPIIPTDTRPDMGREGGLLGIHAALKRPPRGEVSRYGAMFVANDHATVFGALIGVARLVGVVRPRRWVPPGHMHELKFDMMRGRFATEPVPDDVCARIASWWRLGTKWGLFIEPESAVLLSEPIPMRGSGGVWRLPGGRHYYVRDGCGDYAERDLTAAEWALEQWRKATRNQ